MNAHVSARDNPGPPLDTLVDKDSSKYIGVWTGIGSRCRELADGHRGAREVLSIRRPLQHLVFV